MLLHAVQHDGVADRVEYEDDGSLRVSIHEEVIGGPYRASLGAVSSSETQLEGLK